MMLNLTHAIRDGLAAFFLGDLKEALVLLRTLLYGANALMTFHNDGPSADNKTFAKINGTFDHAGDACAHRPHRATHLAPRAHVHTAE